MSLYDPRDPWPFAGTFALSRPRKALRLADPRIGTDFGYLLFPNLKRQRREEPPRTIADALIGKMGMRDFGKKRDELAKATRGRR